MAKYGGTAFALLLVTLTVACDRSSPVGPSPVTPAEPTTPTLSDITIKVTLPYFNGSVVVFPGLSGVSVTCFQGCEGQPIETTNDEGLISFRGTNPITVRLEKPGHVRHEQQMSDGERVFLGHEWPAESAKSFRMLRIPEGTVLSWGLADSDVGGNFGCSFNTGSVPVVTVARHARERMLSILEHELFHAHQYGFDSGPVRGDKCNLVPWVRSEEGRAWREATEADRAISGILIFGDELPPDRQLTEGSAEFWAWWRWAWHRPQDRGYSNLCELAPNRCALMAQWFGPRPTSYP